MGCGSSTPASAPDVKPNKLSKSGPSGKHPQRAADAQVALAKSVKRQCGYIPVFFLLHQFDKYDVNGNGVLDVPEVQTLLEELSETVDMEHLRALEYNEGGVKFDVFARWYIDVLTPYRVRQLFVEYDADDSGSISMDEAQKMLKDLSEACDEASTKRAMTEMDTDGDGTVSLAEFERYFLGPWAKAQLRRYFEEAGVALDGEIDKDSLRKVLMQMGAPANDKTLGIMFDKIAGGGKSVKVSTFVDYASYNSKDVKQRQRLANLERLKSMTP